jgi:hypothetical protein
VRILTDATPLRIKVPSPLRFSEQLPPLSVMPPAMLNTLPVVAL